MPAVLSASSMSIGALFFRFLVLAAIPLLISFAACCWKKKDKKEVEPSKAPSATAIQGYKPGHLPPFIDPEVNNADTFYELNTNMAFPPRDGAPIPAQDQWQTTDDKLQPRPNIHDEIKAPLDPSKSPRIENKK